MAKESIGTDTISYVQTVYNGYMNYKDDEKNEDNASKGIGIKRWEEWKNKHAEDIKIMLKKEHIQEGLQNSKSFTAIKDKNDTESIFNSLESILSEIKGKTNGKWVF